RVGVRCIELLPLEAARAFTANNYGSPEPITGDKGDIIIGELYGTGWTPERMADEVIKYLSEVGVHMIDGAKV
ncbi:hypothetical protein, partial [Streptococcus pneumoniae]|uniref:hypothetical protein n=1 Tax=Streptococcus pneumoniae TaxID=1313 RepID=UPI0018B07EBD